MNENDRPVTPEELASLVGHTLVLQVSNTGVSHDGGKTWEYPKADVTELVIQSPEACLNEDGEQHVNTICPECIESWANDHLMYVKEV